MTDEHEESETHRRATEIAAGLAHLEGPLLPILHAVQHEFGCVPEDAIRAIAKVLNLGRAEVHGTMTFYPDYRQEPGGARTLKLCRAEACQSMGARNLEAHAKKTLGCGYHETTADGAITLEAVYCLGNCACAPAIRVDDEIVGRVSNTRFDEVIAELREEAKA